MQYLLLIYEPETMWKTMSEADQGVMFTEYDAFTKSIKASGKFLAGEALQPTTTATTVRVNGGKPMITDGPFAETREQLGGFYMIDAKDLDEATEIAARIPGARTGCIEIRPIQRFG